MFITPLEFVDIPPSHQTFFRGQKLYYKDDLDRLFVHAGFMREFTLINNRRADSSDFYWNRTLWKQALSASRSGGMLKFAENFTEIFIGHTATTPLDYKRNHYRCWYYNPQRYAVDRAHASGHIMES